MMLYQVTVLLCSLVLTPDMGECNRANAIATRTSPGFAVDAHRCDLMAQRQTTLLFQDDFAKWTRTHPDEPADRYDRSKMMTKVLCEPAQEWHPPPLDTPPALEH